ncbi:CopG family transcriptional regulator [Candidatus Woesearchaeota archaeon CG10_big_fil_rev_8_21_14_0_10_36_11]|nr:MAG: CopG family transcriptional regulator [Candidatus Woesearchaeota archaeon CG10_big_fil_rev_8_21_14_0_10_36_11]
MSNNSNEKTMVTVEIPHEIAQKIEKRIDNTDFTTSSYVLYILREVLSDVESKGPVTEKETVPSHEQVEERLKRLESLGYLD